MSTVPRYIFNNVANLDIFDHWARPYYVQASLGLISYLHLMF